ncbi:MAG: cytochrome o ubiquinol oxidase subunit IV [Alphaproteobacteria bacterium]|nr:cytochrome o ubiquinol oxidase subunit IV [Alphaproteobacteria bacterium]
MAHHDTHHDHGTGASHGTVRTYLTGFALCIVLTVIPFWLVMAGTLSKAATIAGVMIAATLQLFVQLHYFLHLDTSSAQRWNVIAIGFAAIIMALVIGGSMWIMWHLHMRMM